MLTIRNRRKYAVKTMNDLLTYNVIRFKYHGWSMEELNASIAKDTAKIDDNLAKIDTLTDQCIEVGEDVRTAENIADIIDNNVDAGDGINETSSAIIDEVIEGMYKRHGLKREHKSNISSESFSTTKGRLQAAKEVKVSIEGFFESIKKFFSWIWDKICGFFRAIKEFFTGKSSKTGEKADQAKEGLNNLVAEGAANENTEISPETLKQAAEEIKDAQENGEASEAEESEGEVSGAEEGSEEEEEKRKEEERKRREEEKERVRAGNAARQKAYDDYIAEANAAKATSAKEVIDAINKATEEIKKGYEHFTRLCKILKDNAFKVLKLDTCKELYKQVDVWLNRFAKSPDDKMIDGNIQAASNVHEINEYFKTRLYISGKLAEMNQVLDITLNSFPKDETEAARKGMMQYINGFSTQLDILREAFSSKKIPEKSFFQEAKNWFSKKLLGKDPDKLKDDEKVFTLDKVDFGKLAKGIGNIVNVIKNLQKTAANISDDLNKTQQLLHEAFQTKRAATI